MNVADSFGKIAAERRNVYSPRGHSLIAPEASEMPSISLASGDRQLEGLGIYKHFVPPALFSPHVLVELPADLLSRARSVVTVKKNSRVTPTVVQSRHVLWLSVSVMVTHIYPAWFGEGWTCGMSDHALAIVGIIAAVVLAFISLGVAALTVSNHPDRVKAAKIFFSAAAIVGVLATFLWTVSTARGLLLRVAVDVVCLAAIVVGLFAGFRFANRTSLAELSLPAYAIVPEPLWPQNKKLVMLVMIGIPALIALANATRTNDPSSIVPILWGVPWRWVLPSIVGTAFVATVALLITRRKPQSASTPCPYEWSHEIAKYEIGRIRKFVLVENCVINASHLAQGELYIDFTFPVLNLSIFTVSIPMAEGTVIENPILFRGKMLSGAAKLFENRVKHSEPTHRNHFIIRQWVNSDEAKDITQTLEKCGNLFDFSRAVVSISTFEFPEAEAAKLDLTRGMQNVALENKLVELGNDNTWLRRGLILWQERAGNIEELTRTLGMFYRAYNQLEQGEILSQETGNSLKGRFAQALHYCFHDNKVYDEYYDNLPPLPDSVPEQKAWIDAQCFKLREFITAQKVGLSEYAQKAGD